MNSLIEISNEKVSIRENNPQWEIYEDFRNEHRPENSLLIQRKMFTSNEITELSEIIRCHKKTMRFAKNLKYPITKSVYLDTCNKLVERFNELFYYDNYSDEVKLYLFEQLNYLCSNYTSFHHDDEDGETDNVYFALGMKVDVPVEQLFIANDVFNVYIGDNDCYMLAISNEVVKVIGEDFFKTYTELNVNSLAISLDIRSINNVLSKFRTIDEGVITYVLEQYYGNDKVDNIIKLLYFTLFGIEVQDV